MLIMNMKAKQAAITRAANHAPESGEHCFMATSD
jgi:hypothetical protein